MKRALERAKKSKLKGKPLQEKKIKAELEKKDDGPGSDNINPRKKVKLV